VTVETVELQTSLGPVRVWARSSDPSVPLLFVVRGAGRDPQQLADLVADLPGAEIALVHMPGLHSPFFTESSPAAFAVAFDEVLQALGHRSVVVVGVSIGGVVALSMRHPSIKRLILLDTPLSTADLWPVLDGYREAATISPQVAGWFFGVFGVTPGGVVNRDYRPLLAELTVPAAVLVGGDPLQPERPVDRLPSLVSQSDRSAYSSARAVQTLTIAGVGHDIPREARPIMLSVLRQALRETRLADPV
jgi:pimeloyl-ACP methyl ester carboxylesterase